MKDPGRQVIGPYEIVAPLGAGGMGEVDRAWDPRLQREVALKMLPDDVARDPERRRRLQDEARAAGALNHPNILAVYDVGSETAYIVTELVDTFPLDPRWRVAARFDALETPTAIRVPDVRGGPSSSRRSERSCYGSRAPSIA